MKVLNLQCQQGHGFEGWFASEDDFQAQLLRQLVACPLCGDLQVSKLPSAPRLNLGSGRQDDVAQRGARSEQAERGARTEREGGRPDRAEVPAAARGTGAPPPPASAGAPAATTPPPELQALWLQAVKQVMARTEDVGERFPEEARRIHYGETPERGIRGQATPEQRAELAEEGIEVLPLPMPAGLKGPVQ